MRFFTAYSSTCYLFYSAVLYSFLMCQVCGLTLKNRHVPDTKEYVTNITQLHSIIHDTNFLYCFMFGLKERIKEKIDNITKHLNKIKVPVRPNRHFQRWGRIMKSPPSYRFRLDGRNNPKYRRYQSVLMTVAP